MSDDLARQWLERVAEVSRPRPLLVQHFDRKEDEQYSPVRHDWHLWPCPHDDMPIFHHSTPWNAVLFECDDPPANTVKGWATQAPEIRKFVQFLNANNIPSELSYGGNKSFHLWVYIDMARVLAQFKDDLADPKLDIPRLVRLTVFEELPDDADIFLVFDESSVNFYLNKKGRMVRAYGSKRPGALSKTWMPSIPRIRPKEDHWNIPPSTPQLWFPAQYMQQIRSAVEREKAAIATRVEAGGLVDVGGDWKKLLGNVPWLQADARWGAGEREPHATMCVRAMLTAGLSEDGARKELEMLQMHVKETDYDFETSWYDKVGRLYREQRYLEYIPETLNIELQLGEALKEAGLQVTSNDGRIGGLVVPPLSSPESKGPQIAGPVVASTEPVVAPSTFVNEELVEEKIVEEESDAFGCTDVANALRFKRACTGRLLYQWFGEKGRWVTWNGKKWDPETGEETARGAAQIVAVQIYHEAGQLTDADPKARIRLAKWAEQSQNTARLTAMLNEARPHLGTRSGQFDSDSMLFNVQNGVIDLTTGKLKPHDPTLMMTRISNAEFDQKAQCPKFMAFLEKVLPDLEVRRHLQLWVGYSLTGDVTERKFRIDIGDRARNGKSTLYNILLALAGDYGGVTLFETFGEKSEGKPRNDLAGLVGKRLVVAIESAQQFKMNVNMVKSLTGNDPISARFLFKEFFTFTPQFKVWLASNNPPKIQDDNNAIWDRMHRIDWDIRISEEEEIKGLSTIIIREELSGILNWAVAGCLEWQRVHNLSAPPAVQEATDNYRETEYVLAEFIEDMCEKAPVSTRFDLLYANYTSWYKMTEQTDAKMMNKNAFGRALRQRFKADKEHSDRTYFGLRLRRTF